MRLVHGPNSDAPDFSFLTVARDAGRFVAFVFHPDDSDSSESAVAIESASDFSLELWRDLDRQEVWARIRGHTDCAFAEAFSDPLDSVLEPSLFEGAPIAKLEFGVSSRGFSLQPDYRQSPNPILDRLLQLLKVGLCLGPRATLLPDVD